MSDATTQPAGSVPTAFEEARDPHSTPDRLAVLTRVGGTIDQAAAANPTTPTATLLANPVLPPLLLENPGLRLQMPRAVAISRRSRSAKPSA